MINVCVFPAQNESAVEINNALSNCEGISVFGVTPIRGHNEYNFRNYCYEMPRMEDDNFLKKFDEFLKKNKINVVFPTNDGAVEFFAKNKAKISAVVVNSDYESAVICNSKKKTYETFVDCEFCPTIYSSVEKFPCFIKPSDGEGAIGAKLIRAQSDIPKDINLADYVILEYLDGKEMTVDCVSDAQGKLVAVLPRTRDKVFSGMSVYGVTVKPTLEIINIANTINHRLSMKGLWYFQVKQSTTGIYKLLEISMRCAGTMCQSRARGYNLPLLSVYAALGDAIHAIDNDYEVTIDRTLFARYKTDLNYDIVYVDYDGTIIVKGKVCLSVIRFLYQCKNEGKRIILVTRHNEDHSNTIEEDMDEHGISKKLFDRIIKLSFDEEKSTVIDEEKSIFIDNSYVERAKMNATKGIPVFGVEGVDVLQDWRL